MRRFIVNTPVITGSEVALTGDLFHHMAHVLRLKKGSPVCLVDNNGREYSGKIQRIERESLSVLLEGGPRHGAARPMPAITLFQGLPKGDKLELIIKMCTELGVAGIVPFSASRSVARVSPARLGEKLERWRRIAVEAARQSGRSEVPDVTFAGGLEESLALVDHPMKLIFWEGEEEGSLKRVLTGRNTPERVAVLVGPEGGLSAEEVASCLKKGFVPVSLGRRILRTETAGPAILAILQFNLGDMG